jgi:hypothetical protein
MTTFAVFTLLTLALLVIEWRRRSVLARLGVMILAVTQLWFSQPLAGRAMRTVIGLSPDQRVRASSDYASGVYTMQEAVAKDIARGTADRLMGVGVLLWLGLTPALRRGPATRRAPADAREHQGSRPTDPAA